MLDTKRKQPDAEKKEQIQKVQQKRLVLRIQAMKQAGQKEKVCK